MPDKKFIVKTLLSTILTVILLFLLNSWLESFENKIVGLQGAIDKNTVANQSLDGTVGDLDDAVDSLRWQMGNIDALVIEKLNDHEDRIRVLEKK